ncbi:MAG: dihydroxy-acid dehydratase [Actinobacteria bacterium]|nr:dihydroxy-acid dehydratase [Actinomycetota bacterium]
MTLRSSAWFEANGKVGFYHRSHTKSEGFPDDLFQGKPVIGIAASWSELAPCNVHLHDLAQSVKAGVWEAGGFPFEFPTLALGETLMRPTAMLYRNLASMEIEELIRSNPLDGVVLLTGCDKTTPAAVMGATSADLPCIVVTGGPMMNGRFRGKTVGSGTDLWRFAEDVRAGVMTPADFVASESCVSRSNGHCTTMGTASTMACLTEALGLQLPGSAAVPAVDAARKVFAQLAGRRIVAMVRENLCPSQILTRDAFENAVRTNVAIGGSTNAVIHLLAMAGRAGVALSLDDFDQLGRDVPTLVNLKPTGEFLMDEFASAGGVPAVLAEIADLLHLDAITVSGRTVGEQIEGAHCWDRSVISSRQQSPPPPGNGTIVLHGNICPDGAVLKLSAASPDLLHHRGRARVFDSIESFNESMDRADVSVDPSEVLVLRNAGPYGYPGMPEVGNLALPKPLVREGLRDMVRISDARMSGTSFGTVVLHVAPEAAVGGPLALVETGDWVHLDVDRRALNVEVSDAELSERRRRWKPRDLSGQGGYVQLYRDHVLQADHGADFDFLLGSRGHSVPRQST